MIFAVAIFCHHTEYLEIKKDEIQNVSFKMLAEVIEWKLLEAIPPLLEKFLGCQAIATRL